MKKSVMMILALCVAAAMILTACGQSTTAPAKDETTVEETTSSAKDETTVEETTSSAKDETTAEETTAPAKDETSVEETTTPVKDETSVEETTAAEEGAKESTFADADAAVSEEIAEAAADVKEEAKAAIDEAAEDKAEVLADDVEKIVDDIEEFVGDAEETAGDIAGSIEEQANAGDQDTEGAPFSEANLQEIFNLIADAMDSFSENGGPSQAGNIVRSLGNLVTTIITGEAADAESSELITSLIMDEDSLSQLSDGMILDMYEASRNELIERGVIK